MRDPATPGWPGAGIGPRTQSRATAERWRAEYEEYYQNERDRAHQHLTGQYTSLREAAEAWWKHREAQNEESTVSNSRTALTHLMEWVGENCHPSAVASTQLQSLWDDFLAKGYKARTVRNLRHQVSAFFTWLGLNPNPVSKTKVPKKEKSEHEAWSPEQRQRIRDAADELDQEGRKGPGRRLIVELLFSHGPRVQEAAAAAWERISKPDKTVRVVEQISRSSNGPRPLKENQARTAVVLQEWWEFHESGRTGLILSGPDGRPIPYRTLYGYVREILVKAGLKKQGEAAHQFRHTYAFLFLERGGTMEQLQKSLGHQKITTTQEHYDHFRSDHAARAGVNSIYGTKPITRRGPRKRRKDG